MSGTGTSSGTPGFRKESSMSGEGRRSGQPGAEHPDWLGTNPTKRSLKSDDRNIFGTQSSDRINQPDLKRNNTESILKVLQETVEITRAKLPESSYRETLLAQLEDNVRRHQVLLERDRLKDAFHSGRPN